MSSIKGAPKTAKFPKLNFEIYENNPQKPEFMLIFSLSFQIQNYEELLKNQENLNKPVYTELVHGGIVGSKPTQTNSIYEIPNDGYIAMDASLKPSMN